MRELHAAPSLLWYFYMPQAWAQRGIREEDVEHVLLTGETIEIYPDDTPYPSELLLGWRGARPLHIVVATDTASQRKIVITVYVPASNKWVVTLLRGERKSRSQPFLERSEMIGQPQGPRRRAVVRVTHSIPTRQPHGLMSPMEVVIEELQAHKPIAGWHPVWRRHASCQ